MLILLRIFWSAFQPFGVAANDGELRRRGDKEGLGELFPMSDWESVRTVKHSLRGVRSLTSMLGSPDRETQ